MQHISISVVLFICTNNVNLPTKVHQRHLLFYYGNCSQKPINVTALTALFDSCMYIQVMVIKTEYHEKFDLYF